MPRRGRGIEGAAAASSAGAAATRARGAGAWRTAAGRLRHASRRTSCTTSGSGVYMGLEGCRTYCEGATGAPGRVVGWASEKCFSGQVREEAGGRDACGWGGGRKCWGLVPAGPPTWVLWKYLKARPLRKSRGCISPATGRICAAGWGWGWGAAAGRAATAPAAAAAAATAAQPVEMAGLRGVWINCASADPAPASLCAPAPGPSPRRPLAFQPDAAVRASETSCSCGISSSLQRFRRARLPSCSVRLPAVRPTPCRPHKATLLSPPHPATTQGAPEVEQPQGVEVLGAGVRGEQPPQLAQRQAPHRHLLGSVVDVRDRLAAAGVGAWGRFRPQARSGQRGPSSGTGLRGGARQRALWRGVCSQPCSGARTESRLLPDPFSFRARRSDRARDRDAPAPVRPAIPHAAPRPSHAVGACQLSNLHAPPLVRFVVVARVVGGQVGAEAAGK